MLPFRLKRTKVKERRMTKRRVRERARSSGKYSFIPNSVLYPI